MINWIYITYLPTLKWQGISFNLQIFYYSNFEPNQTKFHWRNTANLPFCIPLIIIHTPTQSMSTPCHSDKKKIIQFWSLRSYHVLEFGLNHQLQGIKIVLFFSYSHLERFLIIFLMYLWEMANTKKKLKRSASAHVAFMSSGKQIVIQQNIPDLIPLNFHLIDFDCGRLF